MAKTNPYDIRPWFSGLFILVNQRARLFAHLNEYSVSISLENRWSPCSLKESVLAWWCLLSPPPKAIVNLRTFRTLPIQSPPSKSAPFSPDHRRNIAKKDGVVSRHWQKFTCSHFLNQPPAISIGVGLRFGKFAQASRRHRRHLARPGFLLTFLPLPS